MRREPLVVLVLLILAVCLPPPTRSASDAPLAVDLRLAPYWGRLVTVRTTVTGPLVASPGVRDSVTLLFDTGAGRTLLQPEIADSLELPSTGREAGHRMSGEEVSWPLVEASVWLDSIRLTRVGVWDVMGILPESFPPLDGVLGLEPFFGHRVLLDLSAKRLQASPLETAGASAMRYRAPARLATGHEGTGLTVLVAGKLGNENKPRWLLVDSANLDRVLLADHVLPSDAPEEGTLALRLGTDASGKPAPSIAIDYRRADILYDGVLSEAVLHAMTIALDLDPGAAWFRWEPRPDPGPR